MDFLRHFTLLVDVAANKLTCKSTTSTSTAVAASVAAAAAGFRGIAPESPEISQRPPCAVPNPVATQAVGSNKPPAIPQVVGSTAGVSSPPTPELELLKELAEVLNAESRLPPSTYGVAHHIMMKGRPVTTKFRRLDSVKLPAAREEFQKLEQEGIVRRSNSDWASPLYMVQKSEGSWRPCGDFRRLNLITEADCYPCPT